MPPTAAGPTASPTSVTRIWRNTNNHVGRAGDADLPRVRSKRRRTGPTCRHTTRRPTRCRTRAAVSGVEPLQQTARVKAGTSAAQQATKLYVYSSATRCFGGTTWCRTSLSRTAAMDLGNAKRPGVCPSNAAYIFQPHSSDDDSTRSATVQDTQLAPGWAASSIKSTQVPVFRAASGNFELDECHVDKSGNWLMLLEVNPNGSRAQSHRQSAAGHDHDHRRCARDRWAISIWDTGYAAAPTTINPAFRIAHDLLNSPVSSDANVPSGRSSTTTSVGTSPPPITSLMATRSPAAG